jgi:hypothetical protein
VPPVAGLTTVILTNITETEIINGYLCYTLFDATLDNMLAESMQEVVFAFASGEFLLSLPFPCTF